MFPISLGRGVVADRVLQPDDIAGVSDLYPTVASGRLRYRHWACARGIAAVNGAHVVAFNPQRERSSATSQCGRLVSDRGPDAWAPCDRVEPIDDADIDSFLDPQGVNVNFQVTFHDRLIVAPRGGATASFDVTVAAEMSP